MIHQPYYLLITYHPGTDTYTIQNTLYMKPVTIPDMAITGKTAQDILDFIHDGKGLKSDITSIKKQWAKTDTLHTYYTVNKLYDEPNRIFLNLFLDSSNSKQQNYSLKWKAGDDYLDARNGELLGDTAKQWKGKTKLINATNQFIRDAGLTGNCETYLDTYDCSFRSIHLNPGVVTDSISFRKAIDKFILPMKRCTETCDMISDLHMQRPI